jgi:hypothetical protein
MTTKHTYCTKMRKENRVSFVLRSTPAKDGFQEMRWLWGPLKMEPYCTLTTFKELNSELEDHLRNI